MNSLNSLIAVFDNLNDKIKELREQFGNFKTIEGERGKDGKVGLRGAQGAVGASGKDGKVGKVGLSGKDGLDGLSGAGIADVEVDIDNHLTITLSDDSIIDAGEIRVEVKDERVIHSSGAGGNASIQFIQITEDNYLIKSSILVTGINLFGVNAGQDVTVFLPDSVEPTKLVQINNEDLTYSVIVKPISPLEDELGNFIVDEFGNSVIG